MQFELTRDIADSSMIRAVCQVAGTSILAFIIHEDCLGEITTEFVRQEEKVSFLDDDVTLEVELKLRT